MKKIAKYVGYGLIGLFVALALFAFLAPRLGWGVNTVLSGSMEPTIKPGGVVVTRPVSAASIHTGDVIIFKSPMNQKLTTHRVIEVVGGETPSFRTKGDANEDVAPVAVPAASVEGKLCCYLPYVGYLSKYLKTPLGFILTCALPGLIVIVLEMRHIWQVLSEEEKEKKAQAVQKAQTEKVDVR